MLSKEYYRICYDKNSRYGAYVREVSLKQQQISFNQIAPSIEKDAQGNDLPYHPPKIQLRSLDIVRLIKPYISVRLNEQIKAVAVMFREIAQKGNCAVLLIHHTNKPPQGSGDSHAGNMNTARGASALVGVARVVQTLFAMSSADARLTGTSDDERHLYVRLDDAKANLNLATNKAQWFKRTSIVIANSDEVGVLVPVDMEELSPGNSRDVADLHHAIIACLLAQISEVKITLNAAAKKLAKAAAKKAKKLKKLKLDKLAAAAAKKLKLDKLAKKLKLDKLAAEAKKLKDAVVEKTVAVAKDVGTFVTDVVDDVVEAGGNIIKDIGMMEDSVLETYYKKRIRWRPPNKNYDSQYEREVDLLNFFPRINNGLEKKVKQGEDGWRDRYYKNVLGFDTSNRYEIDKLCHNYFEGLYWTFHYYNYECVSWEWSYKYQK